MDALDPVMLTCVLQGAPTCVIPYAIHTDTPIDTVVLLTIICVHSTRRPFKAGRTGAPVVGAEDGKELGKPLAAGQNPYSTRLELYSKPGPCQRANRLEGNKTSPAFKESSGLQSDGGDK